jgi:hypothetical protein
MNNFLVRVILLWTSKGFFSQIEWPALQKDFSSKENRNLRHAYCARFLERERDLIKVQWTRKIVESQKHILLFDFLQKYFPSDNALNVVKKNFVKEDKTVVLKLGLDRHFFFFFFFGFLKKPI